MSCNVYDESLLDDIQTFGRGGSADGESGGGSGAKGGRPAMVGGSSDGESGRAGGGSSGESGGAGATGGSGGGTRGGTEAGGSPENDGGTASSNGGAGGVTNPPTGVDVLDDMEDGNFYLSAKPPRYGYWYVAGDPTEGARLSKIEELVAALDPVREDSSSAVHFEAAGFKGWGASVGLTFADSAQKRAPYDSGDAVGVSFWVRGSVAGSAKLRVLFPIVGTDSAGKQCGGTGQGQCLDHFATQVSVTDKWTKVSIFFASLHQAGWGAALPSFDAAQMLGIEWTTAGVDADVWLDDVALLRP